MRINLSKTTVVRGIVAVGFAGAVTVGTVGVADAQSQTPQQYCNSMASQNQAGKFSQSAYDECIKDPGGAGYYETQGTSSSQSTTNNGSYTDPKTGVTYNSYQEYYDACVGPSDVNPNWKPAATCAGTNTGQSQSVPTYVPAGGQAPANYDATNDRSADTLVLR